MSTGVTIFVCISALAVGAVIGSLFAGRRSKKLGVMDLILILEAIALTTYTVVALNLFSVTGSEPSALTYCVFGVLGVENGVMGWIKTNKEKQKAKTDTPVAEEPPPEKTGQAMTAEDLEKGGGV